MKSQISHPDDLVVRKAPSNLCQQESPASQASPSRQFPATEIHNPKICTDDAKHRITHVQHFNARIQYLPVLETSQKWWTTPHSGAYLLASPSSSPLLAQPQASNPHTLTPFLHHTPTLTASPPQPTKTETHPDHHPPNPKYPSPVTSKHLARAQIPLWRNWLARLTVNQEVGSSSLPGGGRVCEWEREREHMFSSSPLFLCCARFPFLF